MSYHSEEALDAEAMSILSSLHELDGPDARTKARVHQRLVAGLGLPAIPGQANASLAPSPAPAATSLGLTASAKLGAVVAIAIAGAVTSYFVLQRDSKEADRAIAPIQDTAPVNVNETPAHQPTLPPSEEALVEIAEETPVVAEVPRAPSEKPPRPQPTLAEERALLNGARQAMLSGNYKEALVQTRLHRRRFGAGRLAEERDALKIQLALRMSETEHARRAFLRFSRRYPRSIYLRSLKPAIDELSVTEVGN